MSVAVWVNEEHDKNDSRTNDVQSRERLDSRMLCRVAPHPAVFGRSKKIPMIVKI